MENFFQDKKSLDPDQAQHFVGPDLGPNCLQWLSAETTLVNKDSLGNLSTSFNQKNHLNLINIFLQ